MNKKNLIEKIKREMPKFNGTQSEIQKKQALKIYIELGKQKAFDEKYYFGNSSAKKQIYALSQKEKIDNIEDERKIICMSLARQYNQILGEFNIKSMLSQKEDDDPHVYSIVELEDKTTLLSQKEDDDPHVYSIVELEDKTTFKADLQRDLYKIHSGSMIEHFGKNTQNICRHILKSELINMLIEIGYINKEEDLKEFEIDKIKERTKNLNYCDKLDMILKDKKVCKNSPEIGYIEVKGYYEKLLRYIMPEEINKKVMSFDCYTQKEEKRKYTMCIYSNYKEKIRPYIYSEKEGRFLEINIAKLIQLEKEGLILGGFPQKRVSVKKIKRVMNKYNEEPQIEHE